MQSSGIQVLFEGATLSRLLGGLWVTLQIALISIALRCSASCLALS